MDIALNNSYGKRIENLFIWTGKCDNPGWHGDKSTPMNFTPWYWECWAGGIGGNSVERVVKNITSNSIDVYSFSSYSATIFLDLPYGDYILSFDSSIEMNCSILKLIKQRDETCIFGGGSTYILNIGYNEIQFQIEDGFVVGFSFGKDSAWGTLSDFRIRKA